MELHSDSPRSAHEALASALQDAVLVIHAKNSGATSRAASGKVRDAPDSGCSELQEVPA